MSFTANLPTSGGIVEAVPKGLATASGLTMNTAKVLGRATASTGTIEELTIDADLTSVSANDDSIPSAKATKTALDLKLTNPMDAIGQIIYGGASGAATKLAAGTAGQILVSGGAGAPSWGQHSVVQVVNTTYSSYASSTAVIPADDTTPQNTEGVELFTATITPKNSSNRLIIDVVLFCASGNNGATSLIATLFKDSDANAIATGYTSQPTQHYLYCVPFRHVRTAGSTSAQTFKVRGGCSTAGQTLTVNGGAAARFNNTMMSSITITEVTI